MCNLEQRVFPCAYISVYVVNCMQTDTRSVIYLLLTKTVLDILAESSCDKGS